MYNWACTNIFRCAKSSIPNMEIINKKYLIKTKNSKMIIFMRGGILSAKNEKNSNSKYTKSFLQILSRWVILNQRKSSWGKMLKSDVFKALLILTWQF